MCPLFAYSLCHNLALGRHIPQILQPFLLLTVVVDRSWALNEALAGAEDKASCTHSDIRHDVDMGMREVEVGMWAHQASL